MANVLGTLLVELGINTAAFVGGLDKATYQAKAGAQQIAAGLRGIGGVLSEVGSSFGQFGATHITHIAFGAEIAPGAGYCARPHPDNTRE